MRNDAKANILIVDDDANNLLALEALLRQLDVNLVQAASGEAALRCLLNQEFAIILLDAMMPGLDGFETASLIRERERYKHTPIFFLTAIHKSHEFVEKGYALGAADYIFKPINPDILIAKVKLFVELFELKQQEQHEVEQALTLYEELSRDEPMSRAAPSTWSPALIAQPIEQMGPMYRELLTEYVQAIRTGGNRPDGRLYDIVNLLATKRVRTRDLVRLHIRVLKELESTIPPPQRIALGHDSRLVLMDLLGKLADAYLAASPGEGSRDPQGMGKVTGKL